MTIKRTAFAGLTTGLILNLTNGFARAILWSPNWEVTGQIPSHAYVFVLPMYYLFTNFVYGMLIIGAYAAMRPKIKDLPKMALYPGVCLWLVVQLTEFGHVIDGDESFETFAIMAAVWLIGVVLGGIVGARLVHHDWRSH